MVNKFQLRRRVATNKELIFNYVIESTKTKFNYSKKQLRNNSKKILRSLPPQFPLKKKQTQKTQKQTFNVLERKQPLKQNSKNTYINLHTNPYIILKNNTSLFLFL